MFDFRYHALSLAAVFIALVVGLLLGVAIGDKELVSSAQQDLRSSACAATCAAPTPSATRRKAQLAAEQAYGDKSYPILTDGRLRGRKIGLVRSVVSRTSRPTPSKGGSTRRARRCRSSPSSARTSTSRRSPTARPGTRYAGRRAGPVAHRRSRPPCAGIQMVLGGALVGRLRTALLQSTQRRVRRPRRRDRRATGAGAGRQAGRASRLATLQDGIVRGLAQTGVKVVGIEASDTDPSQIGWYRDRELSTVDNIDETAGHAALVFVLAGADGAFGRRDSAQDLLPPVVATVPGEP